MLRKPNPRQYELGQRPLWGDNRRENGETDRLQMARISFGDLAGHLERCWESLYSRKVNGFSRYHLMSAIQQEPLGAFTRLLAVERGLSGESSSLFRRRKSMSLENEMVSDNKNSKDGESGDGSVEKVFAAFVCPAPCKFRVRWRKSGACWVASGDRQNCQLQVQWEILFKIKIRQWAWYLHMCI